jgi:hypothetical protein
VHVRTCPAAADKAPYIQIRARGSDDPEIRKAAAILNAYVAAEHAARFRGVLWRRLVLVALAAWLLTKFSSLLPSVALVITTLLIVSVAVWAFVLERRAHRALDSRLH